MREIIDKKYISFSDLRKLVEKIWKILKSDTDKLPEVPKILKRLEEQKHIMIKKVSSNAEIFLELRHKDFPCSWSISVSDRKILCFRYLIISENENGRVELFEILRNDTYALSNEHYKKIMEVLK